MSKLRDFTHFLLSSGLHRCLLALAGASCLMSGQHLALASSAGNGPGVVQQQIRWECRGSKGAGLGLYLLDFGERGMVTRLLVEEHTGTRAVITQTLDALRGVESIRWLDDETGWWLEIRHDLRFKASSLDDFFNRVYDALPTDSGRKVGVEVTTTTGFRFSTEVEVRRRPQLEDEEMVKALRQMELAGPLGHEVPPAVTGLARFLDRATTPTALVPPKQRHLVDLVLAVAPASAAPSARPSAPCEEIDAKPLPTLAVTDPALLEFVSRFHGVDNADPLGDHRLAEAVPPLAPEPPPTKK